MGERGSKEWHEIVRAWSLTPAPIKAPEWATLYDAEPRWGDFLTAAANFEMQVGNLSRPTAEKLVKAGQVQEGRAIYEAFKGTTEAREQESQDYESIQKEILGGMGDAKEAWLSEEQSGRDAREAAGLARLRKGVERNRSYESRWVEREAAAADAVVAKVEPVSADDAKKLRELVRDWRAKWRDFVGK